MDIFNRYGRCTVTPDDVLKESHGKNKCCILLYELPSGWLYGYDIAIGDIISSRRPLSDDIYNKNALNAKLAAKKAIYAELNSSRKARKVFEDFSITRYEQLELF